MRAIRGAWALVAFSVLGALSWPAAAQTPPNDVAGWFELAVQHEITSNLDASLSGQLRLDEKWSRVESVIPELEVGYRFNKHFKLSGGYRFAYRRDSHDDFEPVHRIYLSGTARLPVGSFQLRYRLQVQEQWDWTRKGRLKDEPTLRNAVTVVYRDLGRAEPYVTAEHFLALKEGEDKTSMTRKWWFTAGVDFAVGIAKFGPFYRLELPIDDPSDPLMVHIIGISATFEPWKVAKKEKKESSPSGIRGKQSQVPDSAGGRVDATGNVR